MVEEAAARLRELGILAAWDVQSPSPNLPSDAIRVALDWGNGQKWWSARVVRGLRPATIGLVLNQIGSGRRLIVADYLTPNLADAVRSAGANFIDLAGNVFLRDSGLLVDIRGQRPRRQSAARTSGFTKSELLVVLGLLSDPELAVGSIRKITDAVSVSRGSVHTAVRVLREGGFIGRNGLRRGARLLDDWTNAYLARGGFHANEREFVIDPELAPRIWEFPERFSVGGEQAAQKLGWGIRPASVLLYTGNQGATIEALKLRREGRGIPCVLRTPVPRLSDNPPGLVSSALIRADMLAAGDPRQVEIGQEALESDQNLRRLRQIS